MNDLRKRAERALGRDIEKMLIPEDYATVVGSIERELLLAYEKGKRDSRPKKPDVYSQGFVYPPFGGID